MLVSKWVRLQIERHKQDLKSCTKRGLTFDPEAAMHAIRWIRNTCTITEDGISAKAGDRFRLENWQQCLLWILFGWKRTDGTRRFRNVYIELGRGNGKSFLSSAVALYVLCGEGTIGAAVYSIATTMEQAKIVFDTAALMVEHSPSNDVKNVVRNKNLLFIPSTATVFRPLASSEHTLDGLRPACIVIDELHSHQSRGPWSKCKTAQGKKPGSMMFAITTAGYDRHSVCFEQRDYCEKILKGVFEDDSYLPWICCLDEGDKPFDETKWIKANPNLGVSIELSTLREQAKQAQEIPTEYNEFLRMRCSIWTESSVSWMPLDKWDACNGPVTHKLLHKRPCFGALDLATTTDIAAFVLLFPPYGDDTKWRVLPHFYLPEENIKDRVTRDRVPYDVWQRQGYFNLTPGNIIDYDYIRAHVNKLSEEYDIKEIAYDPWNATQIATQLEGDGFVLAQTRQGFVTFSGPMKRLLELVLRGEIEHGGNPVLRWMASNTVADMDPAGNIKPSKNKSTEKIDGIVALIMALARASVVPIKQKHTWLPQVW